MQSRYGDVFNHDDEAEGYDIEVRNEKEPIRAAYDDVLRWVAHEARVISTSRVLELGSGTGNLTSIIPACGKLICVDLSDRMEAIAQKKVRPLPNRRFIRADILEVFEREFGPFNSVISSYTVHHLTNEEKGALFAKIFRSLVPGGRAVFGDLMVQNNEAKALKIEAYVANGDTKTAQDIKEEFFWLIDAAVADLSQLGFLVKTRRFSDLSHGIVAEKAI